MRISTRGRYALRFMAYMARNSKNGGAEESIEKGERNQLEGEERLVTLKAVSECEGISEKYLEQIVGSLTRRGLLRSARGPQGGYALSRPASDYTVREILLATENDMVPVACLAENAKECPMSSTCLTLPLWRALDKVITDYLDSVTLEQLSSGLVSTPSSSS